MTKQMKMLEIGRRIQDSRQKKKITQIDLSKKIGISRTYLSDVENGRYMPSVETLSLIARELSIDLNFLTKMTEIHDKGER